MSVNYKPDVWHKLKNKKYREGYTRSQYSVRLPFQIYQLRKARGWSRSELARRSGLSKSHIAEIEQAGYGPRTLKTLQMLCNAFDISMHVEFCSYSDLVYRLSNFDMSSFNAISFSRDQKPVVENFTSDAFIANTDIEPVSYYYQAKESLDAPVAIPRGGAYLGASHDAIISLVRLDRFESSVFSGASHNPPSDHSTQDSLKEHLCLID